MGRARMGMFNRAATGRHANMNKLGRLLRESVDQADEVYEPMTEMVACYRHLDSVGKACPTEEDDQLMEQAMDLMRRLSFFSNRAKAIIRRAESSIRQG